MQFRYVDEKGLEYTVDLSGNGVARLGEKGIKFQDAVYLSPGVFADLYEMDYKKALDKEQCCQSSLKERFLEDVRREPKFSSAGGRLFFFIQKGEDKYRMAHSSPVKNIKEIS